MSVDSMGRVDIPSYPILEQVFYSRKQERTRTTSDNVKTGTLHVIDTDDEYYNLQMARKGNSTYMSCTVTE